MINGDEAVAGEIGAAVALQLREPEERKSVMGQGCLRNGLLSDVPVASHVRAYLLFTA